RRCLLSWCGLIATTATVITRPTGAAAGDSARRGLAHGRSISLVGPGELRQRLAAILAADVAGYTRLMAADAGATVAALEEARARGHARDRLRGGNAEQSAAAANLVHRARRRAGGSRETSFARAPADSSGRWRHRQEPALGRARGAGNAGFCGRRVAG